eukprot:CCRYP_003606-RB/>CCRYP_003606-RB protein AED:0.67 eAED:0.43 QI:0/-1/0/1/-1/0/1/0/166
MGHPQPPTPIQTDNSTALGVVNNTIQPKCTKAMDMHFHWLRCCINQKHFRPYWCAGATNLADYVTKHHPAVHHQAVRPLFLTVDQPLETHSTMHSTQLRHVSPQHQTSCWGRINTTQIRSTSYHCKGVLCIQYIHLHTVLYLSTPLLTQWYRLRTLPVYLVTIWYG